MQFDYGDEVVRVANGVETGPPGAVVGFTEVKHPDQVRRYDQPVGAILCTVEFGDGGEEMISEADLRLFRPKERLPL
jgi:hypothetical protein